MMRKILSAIAVTAIAFSATPYAWSETAPHEPSPEQAPLRLLEILDDTIIMTQGEPAKPRPDQPVEVWIWTFSRDAVHLKGQLSFDTAATRFRVDCGADRHPTTAMRAYLFGRLVHDRDMSDKPQMQKSPRERLSIKVACETDYKADAPRFANHKAARAAALKLFAERKEAAASPAAGATAQARGPAGSASEAVQAGGPLRVLAMGKSNSAAYALAGPPPEERPNTPVERWFWAFLPESGKSDADRFDANAILIRVDCAASTLEELKSERFLKGQFLKATLLSRPPELQDKKSAVGYASVRAACDPEFGKTPQYFVDFSAANTVITKFFALKAQAAKSAEAPSAPRLGPNRKKLPLRLTDLLPESKVVAFRMTEGPAPKAKPDHPVELWDWVFLGKPMAGEPPIDTLATLQRVDCAAETSQGLAVEYYANGRMVNHVDYSKLPPGETTLADVKRADKRLLRTACDPEFMPDAKVFPSHVSARVGVSVLMIEQKIKALAAKRRGAAPDAAPDSASGSAPADEAAGEAERISGPLRVIGRDSKILSFFMTAGSAPKAQPTKPVELWVWEFTQKARRLDGKAPSDTWATRIRIDCTAKTVRPQLREVYQDGRFDTSWELAGKARKPARGSLDRVVLAAACDPNLKGAAQRFRDHRSARTAVLNTKLAPLRK